MAKKKSGAPVVEREGPPLEPSPHEDYFEQVEVEVEEQAGDAGEDAADPGLAYPEENPEPMTAEELATANAALDGLEEKGLTLGEAARQAVEAGNAVIAAAQVSLAAKEAQAESVDDQAHRVWVYRRSLAENKKRWDELDATVGKLREKSAKVREELETAEASRRICEQVIADMGRALSELPPLDLPLWKDAAKNGPAKEENQVPEAGEVQEFTATGGGIFKDEKGERHYFNPETGEMKPMPVESEEPNAWSFAFTGEPAESPFRLAPEGDHYLDAQGRPCQVKNPETGKCEVITFDPEPEPTEAPLDNIPF